MIDDELQLFRADVREVRLKCVRVLVRGSAVDRCHELRRQGAVVPDAGEGFDDLLPVEVTHARRPPVVLGDVEVRQATLRRTNRLVQVLFLDVDVEGIETHAAVGSCRFRENHGLLSSVDEVGLEPVERLDGAPNAGRFRMLVDLFHAIDGPLPLFLGCRVGNDLAHSGRDDCHLVAIELLDHGDAVLDVLHGRRALCLICRWHVPLTEHQGDGSPAGQPVVVEQGLDLFGVVDVRLATDLDTLVSVLREPRDRRLDRLRPHPVVHR